jgi:two-component system, chemotaxis family, chemotaxis protein CheY
MASILVIDSDPGPRAVLVHAIEALGEIEQATNGADALRLLATKKFSIVLLDLHVRPLDGFVILRTLAARGGPNKQTPIYAIAADVAEQARALREHAVFALIKPVNPSTVATLVEAGLRKGSAPPPDDSPPASVGKTSTFPPPLGGRGAVSSAPPAQPAAMGETPKPSAARISNVAATKPSPVPPRPESTSAAPSPLAKTAPVAPRPPPSSPGLGSHKPTP